jgi:hypothetical protein
MIPPTGSHHRRCLRVICCDISPCASRSHPFIKRRKSMTPAGVRLSYVPMSWMLQVPRARPKTPLEASSSAGVFSGARGAVLLVSAFGYSARPPSSPLFGSLFGAPTPRGQCRCGVLWSTGTDFSIVHGERGTVLGAVLALIRHSHRRRIRMPEPHVSLRDVGVVLQGIRGRGGSHGMDAQAGDRVREV